MEVFNPFNDLGLFAFVVRSGVRAAEITGNTTNYTDRAFLMVPALRATESFRCGRKLTLETALEALVNRLVYTEVHDVLIAEVYQGF